MTEVAEAMETKTSETMREEEIYEESEWKDEEKQGRHAVGFNSRDVNVSSLVWLIIYFGPINITPPMLLNSFIYWSNFFLAYGLWVMEGLWFVIPLYVYLRK